MIFPLDLSKEAILLCMTQYSKYYGHHTVSMSPVWLYVYFSWQFHRFNCPTLQLEEQYLTLTLLSSPLLRDVQARHHAQAHWLFQLAAKAVQVSTSIICYRYNHNYYSQLFRYLSPISSTWCVHFPSRYSYSFNSTHHTSWWVTTNLSL